MLQHLYMYMYMCTMQRAHDASFKAISVAAWIQHESDLSIDSCCRSASPLEDSTLRCSGNAGGLLISGSPSCCLSSTPIGMLE